MAEIPGIPEILKLAGLNVEVPDAVEKLTRLLTDGTTFEQVNVGPSALIPPLSLKGEDTVNLDDTRFTLGGSFDAEIEIAVFNEPADKDPDQILTPVAGKAWLKHKLSASIKGSAGGKIGSLEFGLQGELGASLLQYRAHRPNEPVGLAVIDDIKSYRTPLSVNDIRSLLADDILACTARGKLALHAKLTWADALSAALPALDERLGATGVSAIKVDAGASIGVNLTAEDDFRLVFQRGSQAGTTRIEVRKTKGRTAVVSAGLSLEASVADPEALQKALEAYATSRLGQPWARVKDLIGRIDAAISLQDLSASERTLAEQIGARLGLSDLQQEWSDLKQRLLGLPGDLSSRLEEALKTQVKAELTLEYSRISSEEVILAFEIESALLGQHHRDLLLGNLTELLSKLAAQASGYTLIEYLKTTTVTKRFSFGISIGIGKWAASGQDETVRKWERQTTITEEHERRSFTGRRTYKANWGGRTFQYAFGLSGAMDQFSSARLATANELDYALSFGWSWKEPLTPTVLADALDLANVWTVLGQRENDSALSAVLAQASGTAMIEAEIKISDTGVRALLGVTRDELEQAWIEAMAAALPRVHVPPKVFRTRIGDRVKVYRKAAKFAFDNVGGADIAGIAGRVEYNPDEEHNDLVQLQRVDRGENQSGSLSDLSLKVLWTSTTATTRPAGRCSRARSALNDLAQAINSRLDADQVEQTFVGIQQLMTRPYECRLLGRLVATLISVHRPEEIIKTLKVTPDEGSAILV